MKYQLEQDRWSPIPSLRRHGRRQCLHATSPESGQDPPSYATCLETLDDDDDDDAAAAASADDAAAGYLPFRMHAAVPQFGADWRAGSGRGRPRLPCARRRRAAAAGGGARGRHGVDALRRRQKALRTLRKRAAELTKALPTFTEVNRIDRLSRLAFPSLFVVFNAAYWSFYSVR